MQKSKPFQPIEILPQMIGLRLDKALSFLPTINSRSRAEFLIDSGLVKINGKPAKAAWKVSDKDMIELSLPEQESVELEAFELPLEILFEDEDLLVLNKPAGLVVHPAAGHRQDTLVNALISKDRKFSMKFGEHRPGIVHRLDKDTSGVLVVAKNDFALEALAAQFKSKTVHRIYFAACFGSFTAKKGTLQSYLARHKTDRKKFASVLVDNKIQRTREPTSTVGKWAITHYEVLRQSTSFTYVKLKLETGRTHQIRVHLAEIGHPIVGDSRYGFTRKIASIESVRERALVKSLPRFALHAAELGFVHPRSLKPLAFKVDWPEDMSKVLRELGLL